MTKEFNLTLEDQANLAAYQDSLAEDWELRHFGEFDWTDVVNHYDGTR